MIVRDLMSHPDHEDQLIESFDYFNDATDTMAWLRAYQVDYPEKAERCKKLLQRLEQGNEEYMKKKYPNYKGKDS